MSIQNKAILIGRLGSNMEVQFIKDGQGKVGWFNLATDAGYKDRNSKEWVELTDWHRIVTFQTGLIDALASKLTKGRLVAVEGLIKTRVFKDKLGVEKYITEIIVDSQGVIRILDKKDSSTPKNRAEDTSAESTYPTDTNPKDAPAEETHAEDHYHHDTTYGDCE